MTAKTTYTATYTTASGKVITRTRTSARNYTHAAVVQCGDEVGIWSFHSSAALAAKGSLTGQQAASGVRVIAVVPVAQKLNGTVPPALDAVLFTPAATKCRNSGVTHSNRLYSVCKDCGKEGAVNRSTGSLRAHLPLAK
jgi:hypothetical protein